MRKDRVMKFLTSPGTFDEDIHKWIREDFTYLSHQFLYYLCEEMVSILVGEDGFYKSLIPIDHHLYFQAHLSYEEGFHEDSWYRCSIHLQNPILEEVVKKIGEFFEVDADVYLIHSVRDEIDAKWPDSA